MGRSKKFNISAREVYKFNETKGKSACLICGHEIPGSHLGNLNNHIKRKHPDEWDNFRSKISDSIEPPHKKTRATVELNKMMLLENWLDLVTVEGRPFSILDSKALRSIVKPLFDAMDLKMLTSATVAVPIRERAEKYREQLRKVLHGKMISLKIDSATRHRHRVVIINVQLVIDGKIADKTLAAEEIKTTHHGRFFKEYVLMVLER